MKKIVIFSIATLSFAQDWFITNYEYGKMLYHNPRGISCAKCHGEKANGKLIAKYYVIKKTKHSTETIEKTIMAPNIQNISLKDLKERLLNYKYLSVMPKYNYLTDDEIKAIYLYITSQKKE